MTDWVPAVGVGFVSGVLSGTFGIGGGVVTTPALRLLMGAPALIAVGTPLPVILPSALVGSLNFHRRGLLDVRTALWCGFVGSATSVLGAFVSHLLGGRAILVITAILIAYVAVDMIRQAGTPDLEPSDPQLAEKPEPSAISLAGIGLVAGFYSGLLGLGGGFILVPLFLRVLRLDMKRAVGTSLLTVAILAVTGTVSHAFLGHIDWGLAGALTLGVVPGAWVGSTLAMRARSRTLRVAFALMLVMAGIWLGYAEITGSL